MPACQACGKPLRGGRSDRCYCDATCRGRAHRAKARGVRSQATVLDELDERLQIALAEPRLVALIARAADTSWRASAWLLERRYGQRWALGAQPAAEPEPRRPPNVFDEVAALRERKLTERT